VSELCLLSTDCKVLLSAVGSCHSTLLCTMLLCFDVDKFYVQRCCERFLDRN
jgi:hypothetical protein